jgi:hypothetical protein
MSKKTETDGVTADEISQELGTDALVRAEAPRTGRTSASETTLETNQ